MSLSSDQIHTVVAEAAFAPNVHNIQPARWRFTGQDVILYEDTCRRLPAGDPTGRDSAISLGAAAEGLAIALSAQGWGLEDNPDPQPDEAPMRFVHRFRLVKRDSEDILYRVLQRRYSHRGAFLPLKPLDRQAAQGMTGDSLAVITEPEALAQVARAYDAASLRFFRDAAFRAELVSWMRLSRTHPRWALDGLNAEAMALSPVEAMGAGFVLKPRVFSVLDTIGLAGPLTGEASRVTDSAAVVVFHRPVGEDPFMSGREFHRNWLRMVAASFQGAVMAALADDVVASATVARLTGLDASKRIISTWRIGRVTGLPPARARLPVDEILV
ncbi:c [Asticcacaulis biprosthecium C19]|uniref:C n=1 Tax=Asticcacaulis biprosthecium C19 TaxID=715226 RepID=F4QNS5_9CAUL|nr:hypothetical protein [Asticcacaulis biprosthecium]EGF90983.1 c [Asticcacaulis biprosthecium C19] [Asticcacaulis biprosthecium C19]